MKNLKLNKSLEKVALIVATVLFLSTGCENNKDYIVTIKTAYGDMKVILYEETPLHKAQFLDLAKSGRYDSTEWHRVMEEFMIQGGNVSAKEGKSPSESESIDAEFISKFYHEKGALAAARLPDNINPEKKSGEQFYIVQGKVWTNQELTVDQYALNAGLSQCLSMPKYDTITQRFIEMQKAGLSNEEINAVAFEYIDLVEEELNVSLRREMEPIRLEKYTTTGGYPPLDNEYTVFGKVVEGIEVIDKIAAVPVTGTRPTTPLYMEMVVESISKKKITELYGYSYPEE